MGERRLEEKYNEFEIIVDSLPDGSFASFVFYGVSDTAEVRG